MMTTSNAMIVAALLLSAAGCASTAPKQATADVRDTVKARIGQDLRWDRDTKEDNEARSWFQYPPGSVAHKVAAPPPP